MVDLGVRVDDGVSVRRVWQLASSASSGVGVHCTYSAHEGASRCDTGKAAT